METKRLSIKRLMGLAVRLPDSRRKYGNRKHKLADVLAITLIAVVCGKRTWVDIAWFAKDRCTWFTDVFGLKNGVPSVDTIRRVMGFIPPDALENIYREWVLPYIGTCKGKHVSVDGKTVRGVEKAGGDKLHEVSVWVTEDGLALGQMSTDEKSNEITAIPELLNDLDISGGIVSIDAMGCQKDIAKNILDNKADYILAMKKNQRNFHEEIEEYFPWAESNKAESRLLKTADAVDYGHGRRVRWHIVVTHCVADFPSAKEWAGIQSIIMIVTRRMCKGKESVEKRYYISSLKCSAQDFLRRIREHWGIENNLHWVLDTQFGEDQCRIHERNAAENLSLLRKIAMALIKNVKDKSTSYHRIQEKCLNIPDFIFSMF